MSQPKLKVLIKNCFLYSFLFSCIKAIIYKNDENFETSFHLNFARLPLGWNLRYSCKYYITKRLAKLLFTNLTPKTYNWGLKQTKVLNYICAQGLSTSWFLLYNKRAKLLYNQKKLYILTNENHRILATSNTLVAAQKEPVHWNIIRWATKPSKVLSSMGI